ncbi:acyl-CoA dehydrogenase family protein, partial [Thermodesulfobacteriota bacterium]
MDFALNEEQKAFVATMKEFCEREVDRKAMAELADQPFPPNATKQDLMDRMPWDIISKAHDVGLRQLIVPKEYGGGGFGIKGNWVTITALAEAAGYYGGQVARLLTIPWKHCSNLTEAPKEVQDTIFKNFMSNRKTMIATSTTEADHGSDLLLPYDAPGAGKVVAVQDGDYWVINGEKMFCTAGGVSDYLVLSTRTDKDGPWSKSMTQFLIDTSQPGWSVARVNDMMGNEITPNVQMRFEDYRVHKNMMIGELNQGFMPLRSHLASKNIHFMASLGDTIRVWEEIRDHAKTRIQGGKPIIQHANVGMLVAEGDCLLRNARLQQYQFAWECDEEKPGTRVD